MSNRVKTRRDPATRREIVDWDPASPESDPVHDMDAVIRMLARIKAQQAGNDGTDRRK